MNQITTHGLPRFKTKFKLEFKSVDPNSTNFMSLESLQSVESISAIKSHSFRIQIEFIFKLNQIYLLLYLIHIFCSTHPKITNL
jgi:hypothetical protein